MDLALVAPLEWWIVYPPDELTMSERSDVIDLLRDQNRRMAEIHDQMTQRLDAVYTALVTELKEVREDMRESHEALRDGQEQIREKVIRVEGDLKVAQADAISFRREMVEHVKWSDEQAAKIEVLEVARIEEQKKLTYTVERNSLRLEWQAWLAEKGAKALWLIGGAVIIEAWNWWKGKP